ncbi:diacylglycerol/lipid kinase family protein [Actinomadura hibisca]|uniref:diacylglycerol/lipid kinase family protein n=1 Tax=Actinomadura hibisca TaxID=68565 RepID=UPI000833B66A|nr:diacylglycerol kinase family protein [Actinomadura hibisca]
MLIITNAKAGTMDDSAVRRAVEILGGDVEVYACGGQDDLETALDGLSDGQETVVAAGGDGSLHRLVETLHARGELERRVVGVLPLGTGNDLARNLGIPLESDAAARVLRDGHVQEMDLLVDDEGGVVVNAAHVGVGATAARMSSRIKPYLKTASFPVGAILAGVRSRGWKLKVEADGEVVADRRLLMVALSNASGIGGGAAQLAPEGSPRDGRMELVVSAATGPMARIGYARGLRDGSHRERDDVVVRPVKSVTISGEAFPANLDGEVTGPYTSRTWTVRHRAWRIVVPDSVGPSA